MRVAIHKNSQIFSHSTNWDQVWIEYCRKVGLDFQIVDGFDPNILASLKDFDAFLWHFSHYSQQEMMSARTILRAAAAMGLRVFPDDATSWHFDDKIAQSYLLRALGAPIPAFRVIYSRPRSGGDLLPAGMTYPVVAKLAKGSGSSNVTLIENPRQLRSYARHSFGNGQRAAPDIALKVRSNVQSARTLSEASARARRIPDFVSSVRAARRLPRERDYVYLQSYVPNQGYDLKLVVVGDKLGFFGRPTRRNDFRASGGGAFLYDRALLSQEVVDVAFETASRLNSQCMGFDIVVDENDGSPKILEMSYGFSHTALLKLGGHYRVGGTWEEEPLNAPAEVLKLLIKDVRPSALL